MSNINIVKLMFMIEKEDDEFEGNAIERILN